MSDDRAASDVSQPAPAVRWFARAGRIARMGPFSTQAEAVAACRLDRSDGGRAEFDDNAFVWPEEA